MSRTRRTKAQILATLADRGLTVLGRYEGVRRKHRLHCTTCGTESVSSLDNLVAKHADGRYKVLTPCPGCRGERDYAADTLRDRAAFLHYELLGDLGQTTSRSLLRVRCLDCGAERALPALHLHTLVVGCSCRAGNQPPTLDGIRELAASTDLTLLSGTYRNDRTPLRFACPHEHVFERTWGNLRRNGTCPLCERSHRAEAFVRYTLEQIFGCSFPAVRPPWNRNDRDGQMELDCFSEHPDVLAAIRHLDGNRGLAVEHQGAQHVVVVPNFGMTEEDLAQRQADDARKASNCAAHGITLVHTWSTDDPLGRGPKNNRSWQSHVLGALRAAGVRLPSSADTPIDYGPLRRDLYRPRLERVRALCEERGWTCQSEHGGGSTFKYTVWCGVGGHDAFRMTLGNLESGRCGCQRCVGQLDITLERLRAALGDRGTVRDLVADGGTTRATFTCNAGHEWSTTATSVLTGHWCQQCYRERQRAEGARRTEARQRAGAPLVAFLKQVLDREYVGKGWSQQSIADALGVPRGHIKRALAEGLPPDTLLRHWDPESWRDKLAGVPPGSVSVERERAQWARLEAALGHLSQSEVARRTGIPQARISSYVRKGTLTPLAVLRLEACGPVWTEKDGV